MEHENAYASKGVGNTALGLSIGALGAELLGGNLGGLLAGRSGDNGYVSRYEMALSAENAALKSDKKLLESNIYTDQKILELYKYMDGRFGCVEKEICDQKVFNATQIGTISCIQGQIAQLQSLTKLVVPNASVCPGWGDVTVSTSTTTA